MTDLKGKDLRIGQTVVFTHNGTSSLYTGIVVRFTRYYVVIEDEIKDKVKKSPGYLLIIKN